MAYQVLARRYRPQRFEDLIGQEAVAATLRRAVEREKVGQAYLFSGPRGVGKTSMARILARAINCEKGPTPDPCGTCEPCRLVAVGEDLDVVEIDGASNRGIDDVRELCQNALLRPARSRNRIYIIDEVHSLTHDAFNALLKTLEEPPEHVRFLFATTEPYKVPATIRSRCQWFPFRRVAPDRIAEHLAVLCKKEKIKADPEALRSIAARSEGAVRDALSLLDQLAAFAEGEISPADVAEALGTLDPAAIEGLVAAVRDGDAETILRTVARAWSEGIDLGVFCEQLADAAESVARFQAGMTEEATVRLSGVAGIAEGFDSARVLRWLEGLVERRRGISSDLAGRVTLELVLLRAAGLLEGPATGLPSARPPSVREAVPQGSAEGPAPAGGGETMGASPKQRRKPAVAPAGDGDPDRLGAVREVWPEVLRQVRERKRSVEAILKEGTPASVEGDLLRIRFPGSFSFHCKRLRDPGAAGAIVESLADLLGGTWRIDPILDGNDDGGEGEADPVPDRPERETPEIEEPPPPKMSRKTRSGEPVEPHVRKAVEIFHGRLVEEEEGKS